MRFFFFLLLFCIIITFACKKNEAGPATATESVPPADVHFELMPSDKTGVKFSNNIIETFETNILINSYLYNGGGVAVIDVNNDELPDLYFSATQEPNRLFLNKGNFQFEDITEKAGVAATSGVKTGVTVVDINADGFQDLYVCRSGMEPTADRANLLYINNGDLTFSEKAAEYGLDDRSASNHANFFDFDLDGDLDVYVLNHPVAFQDVNRASVRQEGSEYVRNTEPLDQWESDKFFRNDGIGHFTEVGKRAGISNRAWGLSATVSDFNQDGYPDIFVGNDYIEPDFLYINQAGKGFVDESERYLRHTSNHTMGVDIADFNNDALVDIVALDMIAEDNQRQKELMTTMTTDRYNNLVRFDYGHQLMRNTLQLNTGAAPGEGAPFSEIGVLAGMWATDWSWSPLLADFDNDGLKDLYVTNGYRRDVTNLDYLTYTVDSVMKIGGLKSSNFKSMDEYLKLIPSHPLRNYLFKNTNGLNFQNVSYDWGLGQTSFSNGCAWADLDRDGDLDLLVNQIQGDVLVYQNKSAGMSGANWLQVTLKGSAKNPAGTGAKLRIRLGGGKIQYQELTPTRGFFSSSEHLLHFGLGTENAVEKLEIRWPDSKVQAIENVPVNQRLTLNYADARPGQWEKLPQPAPVFQAAKAMGIDFRHVEDEFIDFNRERLIPHKFSNLGPSIATADVNGDGLTDFFVGGARNQAGALFLQQKNSTFQRAPGAAFEADRAFEDMGCTFFDADGDKAPDLYVASGGSTYDAGSANYQDRLYLNDGRGNFTKAPVGVLPNITASGSCVTAFDYDKDGDQDVFVGGLVTPGFYPKATQTCLLQNNGGRFTDVCAEVAPVLSQIGMVNDLLWADLDGDKNEELIVAGEWLPVTVFKNQGGKLTDATARFGLENTNGWWNCVQAADLDGDGDLDLVAGNLGLNSRLKASETEPLRLFSNDFDKNGSLDPVLAYYNHGKLYPLPLRDMMVKQMPVLKKKFLYHRAYGEATLADVFPKKDLDAAQQFEAKTFATTYFENRNGKFVAHSLPVEAQFAPCNQIIAGDYNADGHPDLLLVGNSYSSDVETGRYDASNGVLLIGDGKGNFTAVPNRYSGFWATKEAMDMATVKLANGKTLYLIANNNDVMEGFVR
ncbi:MAG: VCBS repeat-containing protein [Bacteroidetes bacterium]|nr:VCBS repeat-containing protein [Bacteroidota bacterium]